MNTALTPWLPECQARWEKRVRRACDLQSEHPAAGPILRFYEAILRFQAEVGRSSPTALRLDTALSKQIDLSPLVSSIPSLLAVAMRDGTDALQSAAQRLREEGEGRWRTLLETSLSGDVNELDATEDFLSRACLQPAAENLQTQCPAVSNYVRSVCPICSGLAQLSVLRPEGEGASRSLICSFCLHEWPFVRVACPWCDEKDKEKLPRYSAEECDYVHVEACDTCMRYLKAIDLSRNGLAIPLVDEAALAVLDVWATDRGYKKVIRNLVGF